MSGISKKLMGTTAAGADFLAIEDCFSCFLYTGNGSTQTITNGIDLAGEGGLVWTKSRSSTWNNTLIDTENGGDLYLYSNTTVGHTSPSPVYITSFNSDGYTISTANELNSTLFSTNNYASWTFRKAPRFFDVVTYTGTGANLSVAHTLDHAPGFVAVKRTDTTGNWRCWHVGLNGGTNQYTKNIVLNDPSGEEAVSYFYQNPDASNLYLAAQNEVNDSGGTYVAYLFAHDPLGPSGDGSDGLIACGSFTPAIGSNGVVSVNIGWEPQWVLTKVVTTANAWAISDSMRGMFVGSSDNYLVPNTSAAEAAFDYLEPTATGFDTKGLSEGQTYIYIAIRRGPMRQPESGTEVFAPYQVPSSPSTGAITGFVTDAGFIGDRSGSDKFYWGTRLTGSETLNSTNTNAGSSNANQIWDRMDGWWNTAINNYMTWGFRRAPGFFDVVAYTGDGVAGRTVPHNLGVAPEMMIVKSRVSTNVWMVYHSALGATKYLQLQSTSAEATGTNAWNDTAPTATDFTVGTWSDVNGAGFNYIAHLFATLPGVSKVGSYTGNGSSQTINCGFTSGARFVLIKCATAVDGWYVFDTARGIVAGNDPYLTLDSTDPEFTSQDYVDPQSSGFIVNQSDTAVNGNGQTYIFLAIA